MMADLERFGQFAHQGPIATWLALHRQQKLVLLRGDTGQAGAFFREPEEAADRVAEGEQRLIVRLRELVAAEIQRVKIGKVSVFGWNGHAASNVFMAPGSVAESILH